MTVIAYDKKSQTIAVDSRETGDDHLFSDNVIKFMHLDGGIAFFCGEMSVIDEIRSTLLAGEEPGRELFDKVTMVRTYPDGKVMEFYGPIGRLVTKSEAWGSGMAYAYGALYMGATAEQACKAAIKYCTGCGGKVHTFSTKRK